MPAIHFFTQLNITPQTKAFGPVAGNESTQYRVNSCHSAASLGPAYAVVDGIVLAQSADDRHINIILKPLQPVFNGLPPIAFIVYRCIRRDSLITGESIAPADQNDLTASIWKAHAAYKASMEEATGEPFNKTPTPDLIGLGTGMPTEGRVAAIFAHPPDGVILPLVRAGWQIGSFDSDFAIEIVLDSIHQPLDLAAARTLDHVLEIPPSDGTASGNFENIYAKQQVFDYLDPCVFFSSAKEITARVNDAKEVISPDQILKRFANRHIIYLDIRDQQGLSLGLASDFGPKIQLDTGDGKAEVDQDSTMPILRLTSEDFTVTPPEDLSLAVALPLGENSAPIVYIEQAGTHRFLELDSGDNGFTVPIEVSVPALTIDGETGPQCSYIRMVYGRGFDWDEYPRPIHDRVLNSNHVLDNLTLDLFNADNTAVRICYHPRYVDDQHTIDTDGIYATGVAVDETHIVFFSFPIIENREDSRPYSLADRNRLEDQFLTQLAPGNNAPILVRSDLATDTETSALFLLSEERTGLFAQDWSTFSAIAFTKSEFETLQILAADGFLADYPVYIGLDVERREFDQVGQYFETYGVVLRGYTPSDNGPVFEEIPTDVQVHCIGN